MCSMTRSPSSASSYLFMHSYMYICIHVATTINIVVNKVKYSKVKYSYIKHVQVIPVEVYVHAR